VGGSLLRLVLEFALPKDYLLLLVGSYAISFGPGAYGGLDITNGARALATATATAGAGAGAGATAVAGALAVALTPKPQPYHHP